MANNVPRALIPPEMGFENRRMMGLRSMRKQDPTTVGMGVLIQTSKGVPRMLERGVVGAKRLI